jgi:tRNA dimethylallyltransferase
MGMGTTEQPRFFALVGPTASGKTSLSLALSRRLGVEIISMDSRQIYRGMDVGTGKATEEEQALVPHHGLDTRDPTERYSAGQFSRDCRQWISEIEERGRLPLLVGGTGFFLRSLTNPMFNEPPMEPARLERLREHLNTLPSEDLVAWAELLEPGRPSESVEGGRHRLTRRLEIALLTGYPLSWWHSQGDPPDDPVPGVIAVLDHPRELLYERINARVDRMVREEGLVEEVKGLLEKGYTAEDPGMTGAGYKETLSHLQGSLSLEQTIEEIQQSHRRYARRQITWYRHQLPEGSHILDATQPGEALVEELLSIWGEALSGAGSDGLERHFGGEEETG